VILLYAGVIMNSLVRISNVSELVITNVVKELNQLIPGFCKGTGKHLSEKDLYSFFLSSSDEWSENQRQIYEVLSIIEPTLKYVRTQGASLEINICIHAYDFRNLLLMEFAFSSDMSRIISDIGMDLVISIYLDN
jgi:hypothetical protein